MSNVLDVIYYMQFCTIIMLKICRKEIKEVKSLLSFIMFVNSTKKYPVFVAENGNER